MVTGLGELLWCDAEPQVFHTTLKYEKCEFCVAELHFAGFTIDQHGVRPLQWNVDAFLKIPAPTSITFIAHFATVA